MDEREFEVAQQQTEANLQDAIRSGLVAGEFFNEDTGGDFDDLQATARAFQADGETEGQWRGWVFDVERVLRANGFYELEG